MLCAFRALAARARPADPDRFDLVPPTLTRGRAGGRARRAPAPRRRRCSGRRSRRRCTRPSCSRCSSPGPGARAGAGAGSWSGGLAVGVVLLAYLPFALVAPEGVADSVWRQLGRPLQIESLGAGMLLALHHVTGMRPRLELGPRLAEPRRDGCRDRWPVLSRVAQLAVLAWLWIRFARRRADRDALVVASAAAVVAFVALGEGDLAAVPGLAARPPAAARWRAAASAGGLSVARVPAHRALVPAALLGARAGVRPDSRPGSSSAATWCSSARSSRCSCRSATRPGNPHRLDRASPVPSPGRTRRARPRSAPRPWPPRSARACPVRMRWVASSALTPITESCGPVMPSVGDRRRAARLDARVRRLHVGVRADHGRDPAVEPAGERDLLARRLGVDVDEHDHRRRRRASSTSSSMSSHMLRAGIERERAHHVDDRDRRAVGRGHDGQPAARRVGGDMFAGRTTRSDVAR